MDERTVAFLFEPIQGEAGVIIPPRGYLRRAAELCARRGVLTIADEIQSALGRTGKTFACEHEDVVPDLYILGKALGGGILPISAVVGDESVLGVLTPGSHGSTFGGNPLACAVGREVVRMLEEGHYQRRAAELGAVLDRLLRGAKLEGIKEIRSRGLWFGIDLDPSGPSGYEICRRMLDHGVLAKDTHGHTMRLAPPLVVEEDDLRWIVEALAGGLSDRASA